MYFGHVTAELYGLIVTGRAEGYSLSIASAKPFPIHKKKLVETKEKNNHSMGMTKQANYK